jgi:hypothetical protein
MAEFKHHRTYFRVGNFEYDTEDLAWAAYRVYRDAGADVALTHPVRIEETTTILTEPVTTCSHGVVEIGDDSGCVACNHARGYQAGLAEGEARGRRAERADVAAMLERLNKVADFDSNCDHGCPYNEIGSSAEDCKCASGEVRAFLSRQRHINAAKTDEQEGKLWPRDKQR